MIVPLDTEPTVKVVPDIEDVAITAAVPVVTEDVA
jgi:hypothetical protein